jgi:DNA-binding transcriptional LysR family regulator
MEPDLNQMSIFVAVVETGSFTAASKALGMPKSTVSKRVSDLEERLGARLLHRTTRKVKLAATAAAYYSECRRIIGEARAAERALMSLDESGAMRGLVRVTAPWLLEETIAPVMERFLADNRGVALDLRITNRGVDMIEEGIDLAIRAGSLPDSSLMSRRLGASEHFICAANAYLARHGAPRVPADLSMHSCILFSGGGERQTWTLERKRAKVAATVTGRYSASSGALMRRGALAGVGIASLPQFVVEDDIAAGRLVRLLDGWTVRLGAVHVVYPSRHLSPSVRALVGLLVAEFAKDPVWKKPRAGRVPG